MVIKLCRDCIQVELVAIPLAGLSPGYGGVQHAETGKIVAMARRSIFQRLKNFYNGAVINVGDCILFRTDGGTTGGTQVIKQSDVLGIVSKEYQAESDQ